jgi:hypothetical protein
MIRCFCLADLGSESQKNTNKNWISLLQAISLFTDFEINKYPRKIYRDLNGLDFGENYSGFHNVWIFEFDTTKEIDLYDLERVIDLTPIICGLNETAKPPINCLFTLNQDKNIHFLYM